jgi:L-aspartate oxidase
MEIIRTDCLVIGAGLAGAAYALQAEKAGLSVHMLSLGGPTDANSDWAQGGIIFDTDLDSGLLQKDIIEASDGTANPAAVEQLVTAGPAAVRDFLIDDLHVDFDVDESGALEFTREGGHSARRIIHARDLTGHAILSAA